jgi:hypothetical protein
MTPPNKCGEDTLAQVRKQASDLSRMAEELHREAQQSIHSVADAPLTSHLSGWPVESVNRPASGAAEEIPMIRKLKSGDYRLYSRTVDPYSQFFKHG